ncbi:MAG: hypothetical protein GC204_09115 [Chloroflexi bacterium]|nr:hypothetical protein [Chloroflexota bacterium]
MRDYQQEIDDCDDPGRLLQILDDLSAEIDNAEESPYEDPLEQRRLHDLELMLRYGEDKLENLLG